MENRGKPWNRAGRKLESESKLENSARSRFATQIGFMGPRGPRGEGLGCNSCIEIGLLPGAAHLGILGRFAFSVDFAIFQCFLMFFHVIFFKRFAHILCITQIYLHWDILLSNFNVNLYFGSDVVRTLRRHRFTDKKPVIG